MDPAVRQLVFVKFPFFYPVLPSMLGFTYLQFLIYVHKKTDDMGRGLPQSLSLLLSSIPWSLSWTSLLTVMCNR
jgi:hypothetical protein